MEKSLNLFNKPFESSCSKTPQFKQFARVFRNDIKRAIPGKLLSFNTGHFYCSGFFEDNRGQVYYFSISDVRFFREPKILIRKAKHEKDYTGETNHYYNWLDFGKELPCY